MTNPHSITIANFRRMIGMNAAVIAANWPEDAPRFGPDEWDAIAAAAEHLAYRELDAAILGHQLWDDLVPLDFESTAAAIAAHLAKGTTAPEAVALALGITTTGEV